MAKNSYRSMDGSVHRKDLAKTNGLVVKVLNALYEPKDPSSLGILRIAFGALMVLDIPQERGFASLAVTWGDSDICRFPFIHGLRPLPVVWMYMVYFVMFLSALGIMLGFLYRISCLTFVLSYWYVFLLEKTVWNNHSYLYGLVGIMLLLTDAHSYMSVDSLIWRSLRNSVVPKWQYSIFKTQFVIVYFYAGLKKLDADWVHGYSMTGLGKHWVFDPFRFVFSDDTIDYLLVHLGGLTFDMSEGFLLLFDQTRILGFVLGASFHLMNSQMFSIGMFPWTMLATMPIFCADNWPKQVLARLPNKLSVILPDAKEAKANVHCSQAEKGHFTLRHFFFAYLSLTYAAFQFVLPYSHGITRGYNAWTEGIYGYSWDMMVHVWSTQHIVITVVDKPTNKTLFLRPGAWLLESRRNSRWSSHPDMIKQYAICLSERVKADPSIGVSDPAIYFDIWRSMNGRFQQRLVDPKVDMVTAKWSPFHPSKWIRPMLTELSPWREKLRKIADENDSKGNLTDVVFVADFPGLHLENFIDAEVRVNISVLRGSVLVELPESNHTLNVNDSLNVPSNATHNVYTISAHPACYMYVSQNVTEFQETENTSQRPEVSARQLKRQKWANKTFAEKTRSFLYRKYRLFEQSFIQTYFALQVIIHGPEYLSSKSTSKNNT